jgi:chlorite dismutase
MKLWKKTKEIFKNVVSSAADSIDSMNINDLTVKFRDGLLTKWQNKGDRMIDVIANSEIPAVIFLDEFPLVINRLLKWPDNKITPERLKGTDTFLSWIRSITTQYKGKIRLVITGSVGLEPILQQAGLSHTITTFTPFELDPWDADTAVGCIKALANNYGMVFKQGAVDKMLELIGSYVPHHVQMFFSYIYEDCKKRNNIHCTMEDTKRIYNSRMLSTRGHAELSTYEERLKTVLSAEMLPLALELLIEAAVTGKLTADAAMILRFKREKTERGIKRDSRYFGT